MRLLKTSVYYNSFYQYFGSTVIERRLRRFTQICCNAVPFDSSLIEIADVYLKEAIKDRFEQGNITIPFPQRTLHFAGDNGLENSNHER